MEIRTALASAAVGLTLLCPVAALAQAPSPPAHASSVTASAAPADDENGVNVKGVKDPWTQSDERMRRLKKGLPCVGCDATEEVDPQKLPWYLQSLKAGFQPPPPLSDADRLSHSVVTEQAHPSNLTP